MMKKNVFLFIFLLIAVLTLNSIHAETIKLKNGKVIDAQIIERTDKYIKVDVSGVPVSYYNDEIESIGAEAVSSTPKETQTIPQPQIEEKNIPPQEEAPASSQLSPESQEFFQKGVDYLNNQQYQEAIAEFKKVTQANPDDAKAYYNIGCSYDGLGQYQQAISYYNKAIAVDSNYVDAYNNLGADYHSLSQYQNAINAYQKALQINPKFGEAYSNIGAEYICLGQYKEAIPYLEKAIAINPKHAAVYNNLGAAYRFLQKHPQAVDYYKKSLEIEPSPTAYYGLGASLYYLEKYQDAVDAFKKVVELEPNYAEAYSSMGLAFHSLGKSKEANECLQKARDLFQKRGDNQSVTQIDQYLQKIISK